MFGKITQTTKTFGKTVVTFFSPASENEAVGTVATKDVATAVIIPTHIPSGHTYSLIQSIIKWSPKTLIVVVDDSTPLNKKNQVILNKIKNLAKSKKTVVFLRTPVNSLKAGALNFGISYLNKANHAPQVVFTVDDDVKINKDTIPAMIAGLYSEKNIGAVCSQVRVKNKNKNLLTRLQALEYHSFNITKTSDNGFVRGPLVMQGMLTAFRMSALKQIKGYRDGHLIEDYDITARLKTEGWNVKIAQDAIAWTSVPEEIEDLWKQRVRWTNGGLFVVKEFWKKLASVHQDVAGHALFLALSFMVLLSLVTSGSNEGFTPLATVLFIFSIINFVIAFTFTLGTFFHFADRDKKDWALKLSILPEFIYSNFLSLILLGSYLFFAYTVVGKAAVAKISQLRKPYNRGLTTFNKIGFSSTWGTRKEKGGQI
jgi:cellulose synthase/poly-beta-1,6-N-acetylglucosamine synthase-like glycosyltransferase